MALSCITAEDVLKTVKEKNVQMIGGRGGHAATPLVMSTPAFPPRRPGTACAITFKGLHDIGRQGPPSTSP
jgi:hypothetical protein